MVVHHGPCELIISVDQPCLTPVAYAVFWSEHRIRNAETPKRIADRMLIENNHITKPYPTAWSFVENAYSAPLLCAFVKTPGHPWNKQHGSKAMNWHKGTKKLTKFPSGVGSSRLLGWVSKENGDCWLVYLMGRALNRNQWTECILSYCKH